LHGGFAATRAFDIAGIQALLMDAPLGRDAIFDFLLAPSGTPFVDATTIFSTSANRPTVIAGTNLVTSPAPDVTHIGVGDVLIPTVIQTGLPLTEGSDLTLTIIPAP
jgi:hypothetical protein